MNAEAPALRCPVCSSAFPANEAGIDCPICGAPPRIQSLGPVLDTVAGKLSRDPGADLPLLAFGMTLLEQSLLEQTFTRIISGSPPGRHGDGRLTGLDIRSLAEIADASVSGVYGLLVFDCFTEHVSAIAQAQRVLRPGGVLFFALREGAVTAGNAAPQRASAVPVDEAAPDERPMLPDVVVGRAWLLSALRNAGFEAIEIPLDAGGVTQDWFIGVKPGIATGVGPEALVRTGKAAVQRKEFAFPRLAAEDRPIRLAVAVPEVAGRSSTLRFGDHRALADGRAMVVLLGRDEVVLSGDNGRSWRREPIRHRGTAGLDAAFICEDGAILLQPRPDPEAAATAPVLRYDPESREAIPVALAVRGWGGSRSIAQSGQTIILADRRLAPEMAGSPSEGPARRGGLFRSDNGGRSWTNVLRGRADREGFTACVTDPAKAGQWWAVGGTSPAKSGLWRSNDDGRNWEAVALKNLLRLSDDVALPAIAALAASREGLVIATHGTKRGICIVPAAADRAPTMAALAGGECCGLTEAGDHWLVAVNGRGEGASGRGQLLAVRKDNANTLDRLIDIDNYGATASSFANGRMSVQLVNNRMFSRRDSHDMFETGHRVLEWTFDKPL